MTINSSKKGSNCMSYRMRKIFALLVAVEFVFIGALAYVSEYGSVYADVGSIAEGEDVSYDKEGGVLKSMGFDTSKMPDTYDPDATTNPYGSDVSTLNEVDEAVFFRLVGSGTEAEWRLWRIYS